MKLHISMNVENFDKAIFFYTQLFGQDPVIKKNLYAKWDVDDPAVNFVIEAGNGKSGLDHLGIQVASREELMPLAERMRNMDRPFLDVESTTCCYAKMEKAWVEGEAHDKWEAFVTYSQDEETYGGDRDHMLNARV